MSTLMIGGIAAGVFFVVMLLWHMAIRKVVKPNEVHIVRRGKKTLVYGATDKESSGNSYYQYPSGIPFLGVTVLKLPLSVFAIDLSDYEAYDKDRVPFVVDIKAFFRIANYKQAAERVSSIDDLRSQLKGIVQGAVRAILAKDVLDKIMEERATYGQQFTDEVEKSLAAWGVEPVKSIELMDVRDSSGEKVIKNIMDKKKSKIEMESRTEVAENMRKAEEAEIIAKQAVQLKEQEKLEVVGKREAQVSQEVGIAKEKSSQAVQEEAKTTKEKEMAVKEVETVRNAEIKKKELIVQANASNEQAEINRKATVTNATAAKEKQVLDAEAAKERKALEAEADFITGEKKAQVITLEGQASADATKAMELAKVQGEIELAEKIGANPEYQDYLVRVKEVVARQAIGEAQAKNLTGANIKIVAQSGDVASGLNKALDVLTPKGGAALSGMLETIGATDAGKALLERFGIKTETTETEEEK